MNMLREEIQMGGKRCFVFADESPEALLIIEDWNKELSPWNADPVFGKEAFGLVSRRDGFRP